MPDWQKFANLLGMAQHGDAVRATKEKKRKEGIESEELGFRRDANARAGASASREAEGYEYGKGQRAGKERAEALSLAAAQFKNDRMPTLAGYEDQDQQLQVESGKRADRQLGMTEKHLALQLAQQAQANADRKKGQDRANEDQQFQRGNVQSAYDARNDPQGEAIAKAKKLEAIIATSGNADQIASAKEELAFIKSELDKERVLREVKRSTVVGR